MEPPDYYLPFGDTMCWKYTFTLDPSEFIQEGTPGAPVIYWLDVQAYPAAGWFGWKTSTDHWNDDAAWTWGEEPLPPGYLDWYELLYPPTHPFFPESIDLAFAIYGESEATGACCYPSPALLCTETTQTDCESTLLGVYKGDGTSCLGDTDGDGVVEPCDNCIDYPNGPLGGTCTVGDVGYFPCTNHSDCDIGMTVGYCSKAQEDTAPPGGNNCGDACECVNDLTGDGVVNPADTNLFFARYPRNALIDPCTNLDPCIGDLNCDQVVNPADINIYFSNYPRNPLRNPCPACSRDGWPCVYP